MLLNSHISAYARCLAGKVCGLVWSTWGTSLGEDKLGARARILNTKVARRANIPPWPNGAMPRMGQDSMKRGMESVAGWRPGNEVYLHFIPAAALAMGHSQGEKHVRGALECSCTSWLLPCRSPRRR